MTPCANCRKPLKPAQERHVSAVVAVVTSAAFAFMHGGMWAKEELSRPYCEECRKKATRWALAFSAVILTAAACGVAVLLSRP